METLEKQADKLFEEKKFPEALDIYLSLLQKSPKTEKYSIFCGNCFDAIGQEKEAIRYYKKACRLNPVSTNSLIALANLYYNKNDYKNAEKFAQQILKKSTENASALLILGNSAYCQKDFDKALAYYEAVYKLNTSSYIAVINMANTSFDLSRFVKAVDFALKALELYPSSVDAYIILGNSYLELGKHEKAENALMKALSLKEDNPWIFNTLSRLYQKEEKWEKALEAGWNSVIFAGEAEEDQHINFGYLLYECVDEKACKAAKNYAQKWFEKFGNNKIVRYVAQAILEDKKIKKADLEYVEKIFDAFASDFDETLCGLEYQVPEYIGQAVEAYFKKNFWQITHALDLGCGTGLCGQKIKKHLGLSHLTGVDISAKMLEQAKNKKIYNDLICQDILEFLNGYERSVQLVVAGDVLTYFGDLKNFFEGVAKVLDYDGLFIFTVSENVCNKEEYYLTPSARFVHSKDYILMLLKKCGYNKLNMERKPLRNEGDKVVYGYVVTAQKVIVAQ